MKARKDTWNWNVTVSISPMFYDTLCYLLLLLLLPLLLLLIDNDKITSLNRRIKTQFLFNISNELFCFSNKLPLSSYIYIYNNL